MKNIKSTVGARIEKITGRAVGTYNTACFYLSERNIIPHEVRKAGNRYMMLDKENYKIAEYHESKEELKIYHYRE